MLSRTLIVLLFTPFVTTTPVGVPGQTVDVAYNNVSPMVKGVTSNPSLAAAVGTSNMANNANTNVFSPVKDANSNSGNVGVEKQRSKLEDASKATIGLTGSGAGIGIVFGSLLIGSQAPPSQA